MQTTLAVKATSVVVIGDSSYSLNEQNVKAKSENPLKVWSFEQTFGISILLSFYKNKFKL